MGRRTLVVNADDLGTNPSRNRGILEAHLRGIVTSATLLVTHPAAEDAAAQVREAGTLAVGLHLNLTDGRPAGGPHGTLTAPGGAFWGKEEGRRRLQAGRVDLLEIRREIAAQLDRMASLGLPPTHVDGHHHVQAYPGVMDALGEVLRGRGIAWVRLPDDLVAGNAALAPERRAVLEEYARLTPAAREAARAWGLRTARGFLGLTFMGAMTVEGLLEALAQAPEGVTELMVHPGYADLAAGGFSSAEREAELRVLTDPELKEGVARLGFRLAAYGDGDSS